MSRLAVRDFGTALSLNISTTTNVVDGGSDFIGTSACTITAWIKPVSYGGSGAGRILDNGKTIFNINSFNSRLNFRSDGSTIKVDANNSIILGVWQFVAVTRDASGVCNFFVNGSPSGTADQNSGTPAAGTNNVLIGNNSINGTSFKGNMDSVRTFNRALSAAEILSMYFDGSRPSGITAEYLFNESSGTTAIDSSGNGNDGTITGATYTTDAPMKARTVVANRFVVPSTLQTALKFTSAGSNVSIAHNSSLNLGSSFTVFARIRPTPSTGFGRILEKSEASGYSFLIEGGGVNSGQISATINGTTYRSGAAFAPFTASGSASQLWSSVAYVLSGGTLTFYVNGTVLGTASGVPTPTASASNLILGNRAALDRTWIGGLKNVAIFNGRALSAEEIASLHYSASPGRAGLVGEWLMNEGAGSIAVDTSGNGNHGTITGATYTQETPLQPRAQVTGSRSAA